MEGQKGNEFRDGTETTTATQGPQGRGGRLLTRRTSVQAAGAVRRVPAAISTLNYLNSSLHLQSSGWKVYTESKAPGADSYHQPS